MYFFKKRFKIGEFWCSLAFLILKMKESMRRGQHIMLHYFKKGEHATGTQKKKKMCAGYGEGAVTDRTCQKWFAAEFQAGGCSTVRLTG